MVSLYPLDRHKGNTRSVLGVNAPFFVGCLIPLSLLLFVSTNPAGTSFNRAWHSLAVVGRDLSLDAYVGQCSPDNLCNLLDDDTLVVNDLLASATTSAFRSNIHETNYRLVNESPQSIIARKVSWFARQYPNGITSPGLTPSMLDKPSPASDAASPILLYATVRPSERLTADLTATNTAWFSPSGAVFRLTPKEKRLHIANLPGAASDIFAADPIRFNPDHVYRVVYELCQTAGPTSITYLAVSWQDQSDRLLESWSEAPVGAGDPGGWLNGTYSYFGLTGREPTPTSWTQFEARFGFGQAMHLPEQATSMRIGALLNYAQTPLATTVLRRVQLWERSGYSKFLLMPSPFPISPISQAGFISGHWPAQRVALDQLGEPERRAAVRRAIQPSANMR